MMRKRWKMEMLMKNDTGGEDEIFVEKIENN